MQLTNSGMYDQIKIVTSKEQSSGFLDLYKYIPSYMYRNSIFQMPKCLRRGNSRILQFKPRQKFCKTSLSKITVNDLAAEYVLPLVTYTIKLYL